MDSRSHPRISGSYHQEVFRPRKDQKTNQTIADWLRQGSQGCFTGWQHCQRKPARSLMSRVTFRSETKSSLQCPRQVQLARQRSLQDKRRERQVRPAICANTRWHRLHRLHLHTAVWQSTPSSRHWFVERCMQRQGSSRYDYQGKSTWWRWLELLQRRVGNKGNQRNATLHTVERMKGMNKEDILQKLTDLPVFDSLHPRLWKAEVFFEMILLTLHKHTYIHTNYFFYKTLHTVERMKGMNKEDILQKLTDLPMSHFSTTFYPAQPRVFTRMNSNSNFTFPFWFHSAHMNHSKNISLR